MNANLYSLFERHFPDGAEQPFLAIPNGPVIHYDDLAAMSAQVAGALVAAGCRPGDRVAAQVEAYDWLAYSYDLSQPSYGHRIAPDGFRYFMRLYGQTFTR